MREAERRRAAEVSCSGRPSPHGARSELERRWDGPAVVHYP